MVETYVVRDNFTVKETIEKMNKEVIKAVIIINQFNEVVGIFSNGDMRRYFLRGGALDEKIIVAMNPNLHVFTSYEDVERERALVKRILYPIVDSCGHLIDVVDYEKNINTAQISGILQEVPLVIMAGGKGTRLYPYTKILPKPLMPIGDVTITERIIFSFERFGCNKVIMILKYKESLIKAYFSDVKKNYDLEYITEEKFLGTAGGLRYLKGKVKSTFFLTNCDIIINEDIESAYKIHKKNKNKITMICSMKGITIPYGVVETDEAGNMISMEEKPKLSYLINTGVYIVEPDILDNIEDNESIDMPGLIERCKTLGNRIGVFPVSEDAWLDMGQFNEMDNMKNKLGL